MSSQVEAQQQSASVSSEAGDSKPLQQAAHDASAETPSRRRNKPGESLSRRQRGRSRTTYASFGSLPKELQGNQYIVSGYRLQLSAWESVKSIFGLHNETGNIWSHLAGFALFLVLTLALIWTRPVPLALSSPKLTQVQDQLYQFARSNWDSAKSTWSNTRRLDRQLAAEGFSILPDVDSTAAAEARKFYDSRQFKRFDLKVSKKAAGLLNINWPVKRWPVYVFTIGAMACLLTSATCHLFGCCAAHVSRLIWRFDYLGIAVLIVCSFYPQVYYGFMCSPTWQLFYLGLITALGVATGVVSMHNSFQAKNYRAFRARLFAGLGLTGIIPVLHSCVINYDIRAVHTALWLDFVMGLLYLGGATLYACRIPEKMYPGKFDLWLNSHQLFHLCIVVAAAIHYKAVMQLLAWRDASGGCMDVNSDMFSQT